MGYGVRLYASDGASVVFDTQAALGGITADVVTVPANTPTYTINYTQWAGRAGFILDHGGATGFVSVIFTSGYPVVTVAQNGSEMTFSLYIY